MEIVHTIKLETLVAQAKEGSEAALESLVRQIQTLVYNLALRMLWQPADAEDATQEILIKIITHLSQFRGESSFTTWVYRVATNHLLTTRKRRAELRELTFEQLGNSLDLGLQLTTANSEERVEQQILIDETLLSCTLAMLLCLDREHRLTYLLTEVFEVSGEEGAYIMDITPAAYRKRLSRARRRMREFMGNKCGVVNPAAPCQCSRQVQAKIKFDKLSLETVQFADPAKHLTPNFNSVVLEEQVLELKKLNRAAGVFRSHPKYAAPDKFIEAVQQLLHSGNYKLLEN